MKPTAVFAATWPEPVGRKGDLSRFVDRAVRQAIFWETLESIWERNQHLSAEEVQALADDAVAQARADRA